MAAAVEVQAWVVSVEPMTACLISEPASAGVPVVSCCSNRQRLPPVSFPLRQFLPKAWASWEVAGSAFRLRFERGQQDWMHCCCSVQNWAVACHCPAGEGPPNQVTSFISKVNQQEDAAYLIVVHVSIQDRIIVNRCTLLWRSLLLR